MLDTLAWPQDVTERWRHFIGVHLDLKGVQFRPAYLPQLLADLADQGINSILVEYEDIFPFDGLAIAADADAVWSEETLRRFLTSAKELDMEVIPLQQCLGHLEYVFCWEPYRDYALDKAYPSTLDLNNAEGRALVEGMLRQVIEAHPDSHYIHLGLDEAFAFSRLAEERSEAILPVIVGYIEELCALCEEYGRKAIIWSEMLEHHLTPDDLPLIQRLRDRLVVCTWDYLTETDTTPVARLGGNYCSRAWVDKPADPKAPKPGPKTRFLDEMPAALAALLKPYTQADGETFLSVFQFDLWKALGFRTIGLTACRVSYDGPLLPFYHNHVANLKLWGRVLDRNGQRGLIASSWARGTSWCPPNCPFDLCWPLIHTLAATLDAAPQPFFPGLEPAVEERIFLTLGRCRADWRLEDEVATEMEELAPQVRAHRYEWQSTILMIRTLALHRRVIFALAEVEDFWANHRPVDTEWQRRLNDQASLLAELGTMRVKIRDHFGQRYWGKAFEEWVDSLFDVFEERLRWHQPTTRRKVEAARDAYGAREPARLATRA